MFKSIIKYLVIYVCVLAGLTGMLVLTAKIPQNKINANTLESAEFLCEEEVFIQAVKAVKSTTIDRYADSILIAIAYQYDSDNALESIIWSSYYNNPLKNENDNLYVAVTEGVEANKQYLRYWHGSNVIVRTLLMFFDIQEIYVLNAVMIALLVIILFVVLIKKKAYVPVVGIAIGLIATAVWLVPMSLEYTWTYLVMLVMAIVSVKLSYRKKLDNISVLFMVGGMVTNYLDFLSTETLTLTVPLLLILWIKDKEEKTDKKDSIRFVAKNVVAWGIGYVGMWISKWIISAIVLGENVMPYVSEHIGERLGGDVGLNIFQYILGAVARNIRCLFPLDYGVGGLVVGLGIGLFALYIGYVHYGKKEDKSMIPMYVFIAFIPYIRFIVLHNHAYLHYFFTYRAQMATVLATIFILDLLTDRRWLACGRSKRKRA